MSMATGKQGVLAAIMGVVSGAFRHVSFNSVPVGGFNNQAAVIEKPEFYVDRHISPALIRRRPSKIRNRKKKTNRLHLTKKAKITKRKRA